MSISYITPAIIEQRKALVESLVNTRHWRAIDIAERLCERIGLTPYYLAEDGHGYATRWYASAEDALADAEAGVDAGNYGSCDGEPVGVQYIDVSVTSLVDDSDGNSTTVVLDAPEPECEDEHDWQSPHEVVGGVHENPGVRGHGGGVIIREVCAHCGVYRITDTWAQRQDTGEQGLHEVTYEPADEASLAWVESLNEEA